MASLSKVTKTTKYKRPKKTESQVASLMASDASSTHSTTTPASVHQQEQSRLMQLPQELRDLILDFVFCSTRFASGICKRGATKKNGTVYRVIPAYGNNALSILRSCRRMHDEIGSTWLGQVLFHFEDPEIMLDKLSSISVDVRSKIRHVRVVGDGLYLDEDPDSDFTVHRIPELLKLLPGLSLSVLTIVMIGSDQCYKTVDTLVQYCDGWKELRVVSDTSDFLGRTNKTLSDVPLNHYVRCPQPSDWQRMLESRDGASTSPSVTIYRAKEIVASLPSGLIRMDGAKMLTQSMAPGQDMLAYSQTEDSTLMSSGGREKEVLVVVRRGAGVGCTAKDGPPFIPLTDLRTERTGRDWKEIKLHHEAKLRETHGEGGQNLFNEKAEREPNFWFKDVPTCVDSYCHVDEFAWIPLN